MEKFELGTLPPEDEFRKLLEGSSRAGGARPKALVHNTQGEWLAKFPSWARDGAHDVVGLEATCLELARHAGLEVPKSKLQTIGRRRVLLVHRFDVTPRNGRLHMVSLRTLCRERPGVYVQAYSDMARSIRKHSAAPKSDVAMLFRHMVFNAAVGNVDDHLKNFWMLAKPEGYRLAPAFDLLLSKDIRARLKKISAD
jgi:serine/threonine-protein kinase HipA